MRPTLLVLAAGMGSRYGGLKQMDAFGPNGETILDYSVYDAIKVGFAKVVFVIRSSFEQEFKEFFSGKFEDKIKVEYVFQDVHDVPPGMAYDVERQKPWGTAHAVWVAKDVIHEPFVVINADDFYGRGAYQVIKDYFDSNENHNYALVGYNLKKTLSDHGTVNRGVCEADSDRHLTGIVETLKIGYDADGKITYPGKDRPMYLAADTIVSMNFWGFYPDYFTYCEDQFSSFLQERGHDPKSEFFIPLLIEHLIKNDEKCVDVVTCEEEWFGVTYQGDKPFVQQRIKKLIDSGSYPENLWA